MSTVTGWPVGIALWLVTKKAALLAWPQDTYVRLTRCRSAALWTGENEWVLPRISTKWCRRVVTRLFRCSVKLTLFKCFTEISQSSPGYYFDWMVMKVWWVSAHTSLISLDWWKILRTGRDWLSSQTSFQVLQQPQCGLFWDHFTFITFPL